MITLLLTVVLSFGYAADYDYPTPTPSGTEIIIEDNIGG